MSDPAFFVSIASLIVSGLTLALVALDVRRRYWPKLTIRVLQPAPGMSILDKISIQNTGAVTTLNEIRVGNKIASPIVEEMTIWKGEFRLKTDEEFVTSFNCPAPVDGGRARCYTIVVFHSGYIAEKTVEAQLHPP